MGIYKYNCTKCGIQNLDLKMSEVPLKVCPLCGGNDINRVWESINSIWKTDGAFSKVNHKE